MTTSINMDLYRTTSGISTSILMDDSNPQWNRELPWKDDVERFVCHEDYNKMTIMSLHLKEITDAMARGSTIPPQDFMKSIDQTETNDILLEFRRVQMVSPLLPPLPRGIFPLIDRLLDDHITKLEKYYESLLVAFKIKQISSKQQKNHKKTKSTVVSRHDKVVTDYLNDWMVDNSRKPFPTKQEIQKLSDGCELDCNQVKNWLTNVRKRRQQGPIVNNRRLNCFLDFQFMAHHCDEHPEQSNPYPQSARAQKFNPISYNYNFDSVLEKVILRPNLTSTTHLPLSRSKVHKVHQRFNEERYESCLQRPCKLGHSELKIVHQTNIEPIFPFLTEYAPNRHNGITHTILASPVRACRSPMDLNERVSLLQLHKFDKEHPIFRQDTETVTSVLTRDGNNDTFAELPLLQIPSLDRLGDSSSFVSDEEMVVFQDDQIDHFVLDSLKESAV